MSKNNLSCRGNHPHIVIVARISRSPRREIGRGFFSFMVELTMASRHGVLSITIVRKKI
jgi:hypothetical protein